MIFLIIKESKVENLFMNYFSISNQFLSSQFFNELQIFTFKNCMTN